MKNGWALNKTNEIIGYAYNTKYLKVKRVNYKVRFLQTKNNLRRGYKIYSNVQMSKITVIMIMQDVP